MSTESHEVEVQTRVIERDIWCDRCLTSAAVRVEVFAEGAVLGTLIECLRCDE